MCLGARRLLFAALLSAAGIVPGHAAVVTINPATTSAIVGQSLLVNVDISDLVDGGAPSLGAFDIDVNFDPAILNFTQITFGNGLDVLGLGGNSQEATAGAGVVNAFELSLDTIDDLNALQPGAFTLFTLTFQAVAAGASDLSLVVNSLADADGLDLAATTMGSSVDVAPVPLPAAGWLLLSGLLGLNGVARRRNHVPAGRWPASSNRG